MKLKKKKERKKGNYNCKKKRKHRSQSVMKNPKHQVRNGELKKNSIKNKNSYKRIVS